MKVADETSPQKAAEISGIAGEFRCHRLHRFQVPASIQQCVSDAG
jgi:hypothetical protein